MYTVWNVFMRVSYLGVSKSASFITKNSVQIPLYDGAESTVFPSVDQGASQPIVDLNTLSIQYPGSTFFVRAHGDSMIESGIFSGDVLVADKSLSARDGDIVIVSVHGEMTVKILQLKPDVVLRPKNKAYVATPISEEPSLEIFGVVTNVIREVARDK